MIQLKNAHQIAIMKDAGRITGEALALGGELVRPGVTTAYIDSMIRRHIEKCGAKPSFLGYGGFPASACISINEQVIHGIPSENVVLKEGDIVKIDVGAYYKGFHGDSANTFRCGKVSELADRLIEATKDSFMKGIEQIEAGKRIGDIGNAIEQRVLSDGFSVVRNYVGHGVGKDLHESPEVPNFGTPGHGARLVPGMVIAIEPMVCTGSGAVFEEEDGWTVITDDGGLSAHYEHTVAMTDNGIILLTQI
ncbi:MAG: type I methionyl aminopeptidase [Clostridia bacterium]|nr:type I methionyl aminopeptidase [Clostridia bacterium]MBQ5601629.1 type I methionyl aminopeptidase [Clostridia bacterium]